MLIYNVNDNRLGELRVLSERTPDLAAKVPGAFAALLAELVFAAPFSKMPAGTKEIKRGAENFIDGGRQIPGQPTAFQESIAYVDTGCRAGVVSNEQDALRHLGVRLKAHEPDEEVDFLPGLEDFPGYDGDGERAFLVLMPDDPRNLSFWLSPGEAPWPQMEQDQTQPLSKSDAAGTLPVLTETWVEGLWVHEFSGPPQKAGGVISRTGAAEEVQLPESRAGRLAGSDPYTTPPVINSFVPGKEDGISPGAPFEDLGAEPLQEEYLAGPLKWVAATAENSRVENNPEHRLENVRLQGADAGQAESPAFRPGGLPAPGVPQKDGLAPGLTGKVESALPGTPGTPAEDPPPGLRKPDVQQAADAVRNTIGQEHAPALGPNPAQEIPVQTAGEALRAVNKNSVPLPVSPSLAMDQDQAPLLSNSTGSMLPTNANKWEETQPPVVVQKEEGQGQQHVSAKAPDNGPLLDTESVPSVRKPVFIEPGGTKNAQINPVTEVLEQTVPLKTTQMQPVDPQPYQEPGQPPAGPKQALPEPPTASAKNVDSETLHTGPKFIARPGAEQTLPAEPAQIQQAEQSPTGPEDTGQRQPPAPARDTGEEQPPPAVEQRLQELPSAPPKDKGNQQLPALAKQTGQGEPKPAQPAATPEQHAPAVLQEAGTRQMPGPSERPAIIENGGNLNRPEKFDRAEQETPKVHNRHENKSGATVSTTERANMSNAVNQEDQGGESVQRPSGQPAAASHLDEKMSNLNSVPSLPFPVSGKAAPAMPLEQVMALISQIAVKQQAKQTVLKIKLIPENLGEITVRMVLENGRLSVMIYTADRAAKETVTSHLQQLQYQLQQNNIRLDSVTVQLNHDAYRWPSGYEAGYGQNGGSQTGGEYPRSGGPLPETPQTAELIRPAVDTLNSSGLNMLV